MKNINWKVIVAVVVIVGAAFWAINGLRTQSYSGSNLNFAVGGGPVTVTNATDAAVPVQLTGTGARVFNVSSATEGVEGASARQGNGSGSTQLYEFALPVGVTVFNVLRGTNVNFVSSDGASLAASVQPASDTDMRVTLIATAVVILAALFFISRTTKHSWIAMLRGKSAVLPVVPVATTAGGQGPSIKSYGDNSAGK